MTFDPEELPPACPPEELTPSWLARGQVLLDQNRPDLARDCLLKALAQDPDNADAHRLLAWCACRLRRPAEAVESARRAVQLAPYYSHAHRALSMALVSRGRFRDALKAAREAHRLDPGDAYAAAQIAFVQRLLGEYDEAVSWAEQALRSDPLNMLAANVRVEALMAMNLDGAALTALDRILELDPESAWAHRNRGRLLLNQGRIGEADYHLREALRTEPDDDQARGDLIEIVKLRHRWARKLLGWAELTSRSMLLVGALAGFLSFWLVTLYGAVISEVSLGRTLLIALGAGVAMVIVPLLLAWVFDVVLMFMPTGRVLLARDSAMAVRLGGAMLLVGIALNAVGVSNHLDRLRHAGWMILAILPLAVTSLRARPGRGRKTMQKVSLGLLFIVLIVLFGDVESSRLMAVVGAPVYICGSYVLFLVLLRKPNIIEEDDRASFRLRRRRKLRR